MTRAPLHRRRAAQGAAFIEFAVLIVPVLLLMLGTMELGRAVMSYQLLSRSVRDGARHLSFASASNLPTVRDEARCLAFSGAYTTVAGLTGTTTTCDGDPVAPDLTLDMVQVCDWDLEASDPTNCSGLTLDDPTLGAVHLGSVSVRDYSYRGLFLDRVAATAVPFGEVSSVMRLAP